MELKSTIYHKGKFLEEKDLMEIDTNCSICKYSNLDKIMHIQKSPEVLLLKCKNCNAVMTSRKPTQEALNEYYSSYYNVNIDSKVTNDDPRKMAKHIMKFYEFENNDEINIMDFGGGDGSVAVLLAEMIYDRTNKFVNVTIIDYCNEIAKTEYSEINIFNYKNLKDLQDITKIQKNKFDIVVASAILEHIHNPKEDLDYILNIMNSNGIIYIRTPFIMPMMNLVKKIGLALDFTFPAHMYDLGDDFWNSYLEKNDIQNFELIHSAPSISESSYKKNFFRALFTNFTKFINKFCKSWKFVGGWEIVLKKKNNI